MDGQMDVRKDGMDAWMGGWMDVEPFNYTCGVGRRLDTRPMWHPRVPRWLFLGTNTCFMANLSGTNTCLMANLWGVNGYICNGLAGDE